MAIMINPDRKAADDVMWLRTVSRMAVAIESCGICNALGAFKTALEDMQEERSQENSDYADSKECMNVQQVIEMLDASVGFVDIDYQHAGLIHRTEKVEEFKKAIAKMQVIG